MGKSGQGDLMSSKRDKKVYYIKNKRSLTVIYRDILITLLLWGLWLYIMHPLIGIILWNFYGINIFFYYDSPAEIESLYSSFKNFLLFSGSVVLLTSSLILLWGYYNKRKFSQYKNKRKNNPNPICSDKIATSLGVNIEGIETCKDARYIQIYHTNKPSNADVFKLFDKKHIKSVQLYFSNDWNQVREDSEFAYTHYK